jgi:DNA mismatch endonuclease (patch repair protein)
MRRGSRTGVEPFPRKTEKRAVNQRRPRSPSFQGFQPSSEASSRAMRANRSHDTRPELLLREALRPYGLRYRTHERSMPGRPDLLFRTARLAVFCDGDFWHGRHWEQLRAELTLRANADYWIAKIAANRDRDVLQRRALRKAGWTVFRVWESTIRRNPEAVARQIATTLKSAAGTRGTKPPQRLRRAGALRLRQGPRTR